MTIKDGKCIFEIVSIEGGHNMKVEILGPGCKRCDQLYENTQNAVAELDSPGQIEVVKIGDINYFTKMGVFMTPGLVIDGEVVSTGKVLSPNQIKQKIAEKM
jgi:small redox-active disulfide protein 2